MTKQPKSLRIADVADLYPGYAFSEQQATANGLIYLLREVDLPLREPPLYWAQINSNEVAPQHFLQTGDVIFHPQYPHKATVFTLPYTSFVVCAPLITCRLHDPATWQPAFLAWYLGSDWAKAALFDVVRAKASMHLVPEDFGGLLMPQTSIAVQQQIADAWLEQGQREQATWSLFEHMRRNVDALLMTYVNVSTEVMPTANQKRRQNGALLAEGANV